MQQHILRRFIVAEVKYLRWTFLCLWWSKDGKLYFVSVEFKTVSAVVTDMKSENQNLYRLWRKPTWPEPGLVFSRSFHTSVMSQLELSHQFSLFWTAVLSRSGAKWHSVTRHRLREQTSYSVRGWDVYLLSQMLRQRRGKSEDHFLSDHIQLVFAWFIFLLVCTVLKQLLSAWILLSPTFLTQGSFRWTWLVINVSVCFCLQVH